MRPGWWVGGLRRSRVSSQQTGLGGLPQVDEPVEAAHQRVHLLRARGRLGRGLELLTDARHFLAPLLCGFCGDLVQDGDDLVACRLVLRHLPQIIGELFALSTELAEAIHERRLRTARRVGIAPFGVPILPKKGPPGTLAGGPGGPPLRASSWHPPWGKPSSSYGS